MYYLYVFPKGDNPLDPPWIHPIVLLCHIVEYNSFSTFVARYIFIRSVNTVTYSDIKSYFIWSMFENATGNNNYTLGICSSLSKSLIT